MGLRDGRAKALAGWARAPGGRCGHQRRRPADRVGEFRPNGQSLGSTAAGEVTGGRSVLQACDKKPSSFAGGRSTDRGGEGNRPSGYAQAEIVRIAPVFVSTA